MNLDLSEYIATFPNIKFRELKLLENLRYCTLNTWINVWKIVYENQYCYSDSEPFIADLTEDEVVIPMKMLKKEYDSLEEFGWF